MARNTGVSVENNFTKGLITEVTGVNSPENSVSETLNVVYDRRGRAKTRRSFKNEDGSVDVGISSALASGSVRSEFLWETVGGVGAKSFVVTQIGSMIKFFSASSDQSLSSGFKSYDINLVGYKVSSFPDGNIGANSASFSSGKGYLFITHPMCYPLYVKYNLVTDTITVKVITIQIRDFEGVEDGLAIDTRPATLSSAHKYNLYNQGWYTTVQATRSSSVDIVQALEYWDLVRADYPANTDAWWYYTTVIQSGSLLGTEGLQPAKGDSDRGIYGNTPVPKGHYIIDPFQTNRSGISGIPGLVEKSSNGYRPSVVSFFAGRAFYAGVPADDYSSTLYFSQIIERDDQLGSCYQSNDPTSKEQFDLVDSDGGTLKIQDMANVIDMRVVGQALMIFASNGVWSISGSSDNGAFKATDYSVTKVTSFPAVSRASIVDVGGLPVWWNYEGIFALKKDTVGLVSDVTSLSDTTIKTFYDEIPSQSKYYAKGQFNDQDGLIYWLYQSIQTDDPYDYDRILVLDTVTGAFYIHTVPQGTFKIVGLVAVRGVSLKSLPGLVTNSVGVTLTTNSLQDIFVNLPSTLVSSGKVFKFLKTTSSTCTFAEMTGTDYLDFGTMEYSHEFTTGYRIRGNLLNRFQTNYLTVVTEDTTPDGSCYVQGLWDYSNSPDSGRYSNPQQVYRSRTFRDYQRCKVKIRGNGKSLQFHFFGEGGKPFSVVGWAGFETSDTVP